MIPADGLPSICLITVGDDREVALVEQLLAAGARWFQLRGKGVSDRELLHRAKRLAGIFEGSATLFTINDRADIAAAAGASGLHLGQGDIEVVDARRLLPDLCIGVSVHDGDEAGAAAGADYVGTGAFFPSRTKIDAQLLSRSRLREVQQVYTGPVVGIGGINPTNVSELPPLGIRHVAVSSAILRAPEPVQSFSLLRAALQ